MEVIIGIALIFGTAVYVSDKDKEITFEKPRSETTCYYSQAQVFEKGVRYTRCWENKEVDDTVEKW